MVILQHVEIPHDVRELAEVLDRFLREPGRPGGVAKSTSSKDDPRVTPVGNFLARRLWTSCRNFGMS